MMLGNGSKRLYDYDMRSQLTTQVELNSSNVPVVTLIDSYDAVGNRMTRSVNGTVATWSYDDLYRLTSQAKAGHVCTYTLDGVGNLKTMWEGGNFPRTFTHDAADRLVTMIEGSSLTTYSWTGYGALSSEITGTVTTDYSYNGQDQLALVTPPGDGFPTTYAFDGDGLRRSVQTASVNQDPPTLDITTVVWDGSDYLLLNGPSSDTVVLTLGGEIVSSGSFDLLPDSLGSVIGDIRSGQEPRVPFSYWPYGTMLLSVVQPSFPFLFVGSLGYYYDSTDRDYVRARELMKKLGKWMQTDPMWPRERAFEYGNGSPLVFVDSHGLMCQAPNPCSNLRGMSGACMAMLCSFNSVAEMIQYLRKCLNIETLPDWVKKLLKDLKKQPRFSPADCCKRAGNWSTSKEKGLPELIGFICANACKINWEPGTCARNTANSDDCLLCCEAKFPGDDRARGLCQKACWGRHGG